MTILIIVSINSLILSLLFYSPPYRDYNDCTYEFITVKLTSVEGLLMTAAAEEISRERGNECRRIRINRAFCSLNCSLVVSFFLSYRFSSFVVLFFCFLTFRALLLGNTQTNIYFVKKKTLSLILLNYYLAMRFSFSFPLFFSIHLLKFYPLDYLRWTFKKNLLAFELEIVSLLFSKLIVVYLLTFISTIINQSTVPLGLENIWESHLSNCTYYLVSQLKWTQRNGQWL